MSPTQGAGGAGLPASRRSGVPASRRGGLPASRRSGLPTGRRSGLRAAAAAVVVSVAVLAALGGCGGPADRARDAGPASGSPSTSPSTSPSASPSASASGSSAGATPGAAPLPGAPAPIRYSRSGGLAGMSDLLVISPDGTVTLTSRRPGLHRTGRLTAAERAALTAAVPHGRAPDSARRPVDPHPDGFVYTVTWDTSEYRFTGAQVPPELAPLVRALRGITARLGRTV